MSAVLPIAKRNDGNLRLLIVRLSAIGDVIHGLPVLVALRKSFPQAFLGWVVEDRAAEVLRGHPLLDALHVVPRSEWKRNKLGTFATWRRWRALAKSLRQPRYEVSLDLQGLTKSAYVARLSGARVRIGYGGKDGRELSRLFNNHLVVPPPDLTHVIDRSGALLRPLGISGLAPEFPLSLAAEDLVAAERLCAELGLAEKAFVIANVGAGWPTKVYPEALYAETVRALANHLGLPVLVTWGSPQEAESARRIVGAAGEKARLCPQVGLGQLGALCRRTRLFIGADTGPTFLAVATGTPVVMLFGASDPRRNGPYGPGQAALVRPVSCHPCWDSRRCRRKGEKLACLRIPPGEVVEAARRVLEGRS